MDTFLMGPTGYGFLHPAAIASDDPLLDEFVAKTVEAAHQLSMTSYVHWDIDSNGLTQKCADPLKNSLHAFMSGDECCRLLMERAQLPGQRRCPVSLLESIV